MKNPPSVAGENNSPRSEEEKEKKGKKGRMGRKGRKKTTIRKIAKTRCPLKLSENSLWNTRSSSQSLGQAR